MTKNPFFAFLRATFFLSKNSNFFAATVGSKLLKCKKYQGFERHLGMRPETRPESGFWFLVITFFARVDLKLFKTVNHSVILPLVASNDSIA